MSEDAVSATLLGSVRGRLFLAALIGFIVTPPDDALAMIVVMTPLFAGMELLAAAVARLRAGEAMTGLFIVRQRTPIGPAINDLLMIWAASEADEWISMVEFVPM